MDNETGFGSEILGRVFQVTVYGDSASEIEIGALAAAQAFFGPGVPLEVIPDYQAFGEPRRAKKYSAGVRVRAV